MGLFARLFGIAATKPPRDPACWTFGGGAVELDLGRAPELADRGGAVRLEGGDLPVRVLVLRGEDGELHAFVNACPHAKRRLDPLPGADQVRCCSIGKTTFDYAGKRLSGMGKDDITPLEVREEDDRAVLTLP